MRKRDYHTGFETFVRPPAPDATPEALSAQIADFLATGGKIQQLEIGNSGLNINSDSMRSHSLRTAAGLKTPKKNRVEFVFPKVIKREKENA